MLKKNQLLKIILGAAIFTFGIYNIHQRVGISEGGVIGLNLLIEHWFNISLSYISIILDVICYLLSIKALGFNFIKTSIVSSLFISFFYKVWEMIPIYLFPDLSNHLLLAAIIGGLFVGVGVGIIIKQGGSSGGDDALALTISQHFHVKLAHAYMFTDFTVLLLSLSYIPLSNIIFSLITVTISSNVIDFIKESK